ncbi:MAG: hypothetical protein H5T69_07935 [Chloroflexi bacterium]|nr:hypothetical protein [Chloroflexota bacterium]
MNLVQTLCRLQALDTEWDEKAQRFQVVHQQLADQGELERRRQAQTERERQLAEARIALKDAELQLTSLQQKFDAVEKDLYSGRITSPRELENLRQERDYLRRHISETEDHVLLGLTQVEELEKAVKAGAEQLRQFEAAWAGEQERLREQYRELGARLQQLKREREALRAGLGRSELAVYDKLRRAKGGQALAPMEENVCLICRVTVPSHKSEMARIGTTLVTCEGCGRILYPA